MATGLLERFPGKLPLSIALSCAAIASATVRAEVEVGGAVSVGVSRTDNIFLAPSNERSETVYQISPSFQLQQTTPRIASELAYQLDAYSYSSLGERNVYNRFNGQTRLQLDPNNFFFDLGANRSQSIKNPRLVIPRTTLPITGNFIDRDEAFAGPAFAYPFAANATVAGSYRRSWIRYDDSELGSLPLFAQDAESDTTVFSIDNYRRQRGLSWAARYNSMTTDYDVLIPWKYKQAVVELGGWIGEGIRVFAVGGKESPWDQPFESSLEDTLWEVGVSRAAGSSFSAELVAGERTFGSTRRGRFDFAFRRGSTTFSYVEQPTTQERNPYTRGGLLDPSQPDDFLAEAGAPQRFIAKRLQWDLRLDFRQTQFGFILFDETREQRSLVDGTPLHDIDQAGGSFTATRQLGVRTGIQLVLSRLRRQYDLNEDIDLLQALIRAHYDLGPRTELALNYAHWKEDADGGAVAANHGYTSNTISLLLTRAF